MTESEERAVVLYLAILLGRQRRTNQCMMCGSLMDRVVGTGVGGTRFTMETPAGRVKGFPGVPGGTGFAYCRVCAMRPVMPKLDYPEPDPVPYWLMHERFRIP